MKLADYVIEFFADRGVRDVFLVYGSAIGDLVDAFTKTDRIRYVCVMHEQAGAFAAEVVTKISGRLGVTLVTSGPGGTNLVTGIANCWYDSIPNVFLTGQVHSAFLRPDPSVRQLGFQENDIVSMVQPITKYAVMVTDPARIRYELERAVWEATHGRPGPVLLDLPLDLQKVDVDPAALDGFTPPADAPTATTPMAEAIDRYLEALAHAERPVLLIGGGVRLAGGVEAVRALGATLRIPCLPTWNALDVFTSDWELYRGRVGTYGGPGRNFAIQNADLLLTIGCRISGRITGGVPDTFARAATKFIVDVDDASLDPKLQQVRGDVNVRCDARVFADALTARARGRRLPRFDAWLERTRDWRDRYDPVRPEFRQTRDIVHPYVFMDELSRRLDARDIVVADCGGNVVVTNQAFRTKYGQRLVSSNGNSPMGFSFAGAIGACVAAPDRRVVCIIGDGGFNMNVQELQTLVTYELPLKTFIMNNHVYGITKAYQDTNFGGRYEAAGPKGYRPPDFVKLVQGYGVATETIRDHGELAAKLERVLAYPGAIVCDVNMHEHIRYEPRIFGWNTPIEDMYPYLPRAEFRANMLIDPVPGWETPAMPGGARTGAPPAAP
jgi:acetolactate synthase-1/2/3 large subunit